MRNLKLPAVLSLLLFPLFSAGPACAKVYIDIDSPSFQQFPIAVADFKPLRPFPENEKLSLLFSDTLSRDLTLTGYFHLLDRKAFLEDPKRAGITAEGIRFEDWTVIGAEYLVKGGFQTDGRELMAEFRLFDVVRGELVVGKRYAGKSGDHNRMVMQFVSEILLALTGEAGLFDTRIAFVKKSAAAAEIYTIHFDGSDPRRVTNLNALTLSPRWSPDGRFLAFTSYKEGNPDIYLRDLESGSTRKIVFYPGLNLPGSWSRDSKRLLVTLSRDGNQEIYDMNVENNLLLRLTRDFSIDVSPVRSPDERRIAFVSNRNGSPQIYIMDADGANVRRLTYLGNYNTSPAWSPKGKKIAYEGSVNGRFQIFAIDAEGGDPQQLTFEGGDHESPSWSPDGRYLVYCVRGYGGSRIEIMNAGGQGVRVLHEDKDASQSPFWSPHLR
ncbi:MAG: Tol-Pal system beta propeller repeat protein TolB [Syntrophobacterales bacterium CG_4_8_14_3_um_filter_58_8]|nr:MAG: Tol-Pal system beta propeller repeat protein TolB [Syntrophaceae bacterium CG2_30_58_14]PIV00603.1 MAG: Tol-Pal system beta propeller repeat protein TolB [Syntrophobacterales bacterium CG03_land_8_20_14_0_80_58_14]PJC72367.1 MAG: Tol-Pal system beta propeller repeat protein TolB [Syntrophobacterales bacterium CG_4_8_14_3_um_filter_58_8]